MWIFQHDGECGFSGRWHTITSSRAFSASLLQPPNYATHWIRYITGSTANLKVGEILTGGSGSGTYLLVEQIIEQGTSAGNNAQGIILVRNLSGTDWVAGETVTGGTSTGTVVVAGPPVPIVSKGPAKTLLITVETAPLNFVYSGVPATVTGATTAEDSSMNISSGGSFILRGPINIKNFRAINATNTNGAIMKYALHF